MGVINNPIIVEDRFKEIFSYLPDMKFNSSLPAFPVRFSYGDDYELKAFLISSENEENRIYPLIWLVYPFQEKHIKTRVELKGVNLILAVDTSKAGLNPERIRLNYENVLMPLYGNIVKVLTRANIINMKYEFNITKFPNYSHESSNGKEHKTISRWDALKVNFDCTIIDTCLKQIKL